MDYYVIPKRIRAVSGKEGLTVILGHTKGTIQRNIIEPLQSIWGTALVGDIKSDNTAILFGEKVHCLGADKVTRVDVIRGSSIKYCYGDEIVTWNSEVFEMLKSRLDKPYSRFDGTCNPDNPNHWFYKFCYSDNGADKYIQEYSIYDNPFLDPTFIQSLENEYRGTVYFDRYILGHWTIAEGLIYKRFADDYSADKTMMIEHKPNALSKIVVGVDFGGSGSAHTFVATGTDRANFNLYALLSERHENTEEQIDPERLGELFCEFIYKVIAMYGSPIVVYCDSAEQTLILGLRASAKKKGLGWLRIENALKTTINDRIRCTTRLMAQGRFYYMAHGCESLINALNGAVWNPKNLIKDERLDDGTSDIDTLDAFEYTFERDISKLIKYE